MKCRLLGVVQCLATTGKSCVRQQRSSDLRSIRRRKYAETSHASFIQIGSKWLVGGTASAILGGKFETGFEYAVAAATLYCSYTKFVGFEPGLEGGEDLEDGTSRPQGELKQPPTGKNVSALNKPLTGDFWGKDFWTQGGPVSKLINFLPGGNAVSGYHDTWVNNIGSSVLKQAMTIPPSIGLSYGAQFGGQLSPLTVQMSIRDSERYLPKIISLRAR